MKYSVTEFAKASGVDRHTLKRWHDNGKLVRRIDSDGKSYYDDRDLSFIKNNLGLNRNGQLMKYDGKWIDLRNVPCRPFEERLDWNRAAASSVEIPFCYSGIKDQLVILGCNNNQIKISYNGIEKNISTDSLIKCNLAFLLDVFSRDYRYKPGDHVVNEKGFDITIQECFRRDDNKKSYLYRCNSCGQVNTIEEYNISRNKQCPVCAGTKVIHGINDIETTDKWMIEYFPDKSISKLYSRGSHVAFNMRCPLCGRISDKKIAIRTLYREHSIGCPCMDGISYPNKYMYSVLEQLKDHKIIQRFTKEWSPKWIGRRRFDFRVLLSEQVCIVIEMDGGLGHGFSSYNSEGITPEETLEIDRWKDQEAAKRNITVYRVSAIESNSSFLRKHIQETIGDVVDLSVVDWNIANKLATSNLICEVCAYYERNKPISINQLAKVFGIGRSTALRYVKKGEEIGWTTYDKELMRRNRTKASFFGAEASRRSVLCFDLEEIFIKEYDSIKSAAKDMGVSETAIANCCKGKTRKSAGYKWRYKEGRG